MECIRRGLVPEQMEDKWFIYWESGNLFFHRSWSGYCIYVALFADEGDCCKMTQAEVNRNKRQYSETSDRRDAEMISYLVDALLLQLPTATFPCDEQSPDKQASNNWHVAGRAMLDQHPGNE